MSALRKAQFEHDEQLPPPVSDDDLAEVEWLEANAERLILGYRIDWGFSRADKGEVTQAMFAKAVQDHVNQRQIDGKDQTDALGQLVIHAMGFGSAGLMLDLATYLLGAKSALKHIAVELLKPHAALAVQLQEEQDDLERRAGF